MVRLRRPPSVPYQYFTIPAGENIGIRGESYAPECLEGMFSEAGEFRSSHRFLLLEMLNVLDWWHEAVLDMLLWATRVVS